MIQHYVHYFHPKYKNQRDARSCVVVNCVYLPKVYIPHYYHSVIGILKNSNITAKIIKTEGMVKKKIAFMKYIKIQSCHIGIIFEPKHLIWQRQKCVHIHSHIMHHHTGNLYCDVVPNVHVLIFLTKKHMINIPTLDLEFVFTFIIYLHIVQHMEDFR